MLKGKLGLGICKDLQLHVNLAWLFSANVFRCFVVQQNDQSYFGSLSLSLILFSISMKVLAEGWQKCGLLQLCFCFCRPN